MWICIAHAWTKNCQNPENRCSTDMAMPSHWWYLRFSLSTRNSVLFECLYSDQPNPLFPTNVTSHKVGTLNKGHHGGGWNLYNNFKAHSVCWASTMAAAEKGALMVNILQTVDWSRDSIFKRFYYCPTSINSYAHTAKRKEGDGETSTLCHCILCWSVCHIL